MVNIVTSAQDVKTEATELVASCSGHMDEEVGSSNPATNASRETCCKVWQSYGVATEMLTFLEEKESN